MIKKLQKSFILFVLFTFVAQSVLVHVPVKAAELPTVVSLTDVLVSDNEELTTEATTLKEKQELFVKLGLTMKDGEITKEATLMALPSQLHGDVFGEGNVVDEQNKAVGSYTIANNSIKILFNDEAVTGAPYHLVFKATYNAVETDVKAEKNCFFIR
ncbi:hypothetical protein [Brochothrix thermosphacta]|uniref:hypothetical protein n=1 Tax=Brochothrix thermosphacta TaxID=2756 RepID=UPI000D0FA1FE|nr:hypothetical protein [Brochothrix thermosphacta]SOC25930.1 exported hypothetical protein [Brochothrix thermosphacta]